MKASELMIGNWVYVPHNGNATHYGRITAILPSGAVEVDLNGNTVLCGSIDPIPLTPEILEKNGWKYEFDKDKYMVQYNLGEDGKNCWKMWSITKHCLDIQRQDEKIAMYSLKVQRVVIPCDYVHQLQQALHLCGIEKEIEL